MVKGIGVLPVWVATPAGLKMRFSGSSQNAGQRARSGWLRKITLADGVAIR